jgi:large subunit ribosomal protein L27Ae
MDKYHPGYFGKVGMRYFHKTNNKSFNKCVNLDKLHTLLADGAMEVDGKVPIIDTVGKVCI